MTSIEARDITKVYRIYRSPAQRLKEIVLRRPLHARFAALDRMNFSVARGETFGIIGENGAGKSTLLKILARTLKPTSGSLVTTGRIAALLELGAGFNPELTGEENIFLNAYLMGLTKAEVERKKAGIIAFSELGDFIRRPVKTYSSGMHVRLAFSIATSVDPDILIVDEALSVGDQHFQKKCIDRMMSFREQAKTIVFCTHNLYQTQELCERTLWIKEGAMRMLGRTGNVVTAYQNFMREKDSYAVQADAPSPESPVRIASFSVDDGDGNPLEYVRTGQPLRLRVALKSADPARRCTLGFAVVRNDEEVCYATSTAFDGREPFTAGDGREITVTFPSFRLLSGIYYFRIALLDDTALHLYDSASSAPLTVVSGTKELGMVFMDHRWEL